jgi:hypothetical protein
MKSIKIKEIDKLPGKRLSDKDIFSFNCHSELSCFNKCCRNLNLFLYPYDVLRLKNSLKISSDQFLDNYVDIVLRPDNFFPDVLLQMSDNSENTCPFLKSSGCSVYPDRPDTCRTFPVEQGSFLNPGNNKPELIHFFRPPDFCMGQHEDQELTIKSWAKDQDAVKYNRMTLKWAEIKSMFHTDPWDKQGPNGPKGKMAFMAAYNLDPYRDFLFNSSFLKRYKVKTATLKKIKNDDRELMKFGFSWIKFFVWGVRTKDIMLR